MIDGWSWPDHLDAVIAARLDNEQVRVLDTRIEPGDVVSLHSRRGPSADHVVSVEPKDRR